jgi:hypothetical protein
MGRARILEPPFSINGIPNSCSECPLKSDIDSTIPLGGSEFIFSFTTKKTICNNNKNEKLKKSKIK